MAIDCTAIDPKKTLRENSHFVYKTTRMDVSTRREAITKMPTKSRVRDAQPSRGRENFEALGLFFRHRKLMEIEGSSMATLQYLTMVMYDYMIVYVYYRCF